MKTFNFREQQAEILEILKAAEEMRGPKNADKLQLKVPIWVGKFLEKKYAQLDKLVDDLYAANEEIQMLKYQLGQKEKRLNKLETTLNRLDYQCKKLDVRNTKLVKELNEIYTDLEKRNITV